MIRAAGNIILFIVTAVGGFEAMQNLVEFASRYGNVQYLFIDAALVLALVLLWFSERRKHGD